MPLIQVLDPREKWVAPVLLAADSRGWSAKRIYEAADAAPGYALLFVHAHPEILRHDRALARELASRGDVTLITDLTQTQVYEDKRAQTRLWADWMPTTWIFNDLDEALSTSLPFPLISKADVGASSYNVRILKDRAELERHLREIFGAGVPVEHCDSKGTRSLQRGYAILQEFVPHQVTYRVNAIGRQRAAFYRYCFADRPMAQTGNVEPARVMTDDLASLFAWSDRFFAHAGTQWCALDALRHPTRGWVLLETSLRWPWPSPGACNQEGRFFLDGRETRRWIEMFQILFDELEAGSF
jgi:hypothetical protein